MSDLEPNRIDAFLEADPAARRALIASGGDREAIIGGLEALVGRDASKVVEVGRAMIDVLEDGTTKARTLRSITTALAYLGRHHESIDTSVLARKVAQSSGDPIESARALVAAMHPLCESGRIDEAIAGGEEARRELIASGAPELALRVDLNLGNVRKMQGNAEKALEHLQRVTDALESDDPILPHALNAEGECHFVLDDMAAADSAFEEASRILGEDGGIAAAIVIGNRADVASREGRVEEAIDLFTEARRRSDALGVTGHSARLTMETGGALEGAGLLDEAAQQIESVLDVLEASEQRFEHARALMILARIDLVSHRFDRAVERSDRASRGFLELGNRRLVDRATLIAIEASIAEGALEAARARLAGVVESETGPVTRIGRFSMEAELHAREQRWDDAIESARRASETAAELGVIPIMIECDSRLARMQIRGGRQDDGIQTARKAVTSIEGIRSGFGASRIRAAFLASRTAAYESLVEGLVGIGDEASTREAFEIMERSRNRGLVERSLERIGFDDEQRPEDDAVRVLRRRLLSLYAAMDPDGLDDQRRIRIDARQAEIDELEIELDRIMLATDRRAASVEVTMGVEEIGASLPSDTALIEYFVADGRLLAFTILANDLKVVDTGVGVAELSTAVTELHFQCRRRLRGHPGPRVAARMHDACDAVLRELHRRVVAPLPESVRTASRWLVVPHGPLVAVPFHALLSDDGYVLDRTVVTTASSAGIAVRLSRTPDRGRGVVVATVSDDRAPSIREEGERIAALHDDAIRLDGDAASAEAVLAGLARARVAHLACHGRFLPGSPRSSGLRLADRWVTIRDIRELPATPPVVVLSGCETGLHPQLGANELLGLSRAFAMQGTRTVIASLWSVHDSSSTALMTFMHEAIIARTSEPSGSLALPLIEAQKKIRTENPHPAYWAPFFCTEPCIETQSFSRNRTADSTVHAIGE